ncbi:MAG: TonB-dependent receptor, partial [Pseudomonadota bacterium]
PTTTEFANPDGGGFNTNLDPAQALHREFGVRGQTRHGSVFSAALYRIDVQDELLPFELATNPGRDFFENAGSSDRQGIELAFKRQWSGGLSLQLMHTLSDFRFDQFVTDDGDDFSGLRTPGNARHRSFIALRRDIGDGRFAAVEAVRFGRVPVNNANDTFTDSYLLVNLRAGWQWQSGAWRYTPFFAINNLFDVDYVANTRINAFGGRFFESGPDRSVYLGIKAAFRAPGD